MITISEQSERSMTYRVKVEHLTTYTPRNEVKEECSYTWEIRNFQFFSQNFDPDIESPQFTVGCEKIKWQLYLFLNREDTDYYAVRLLWRNDVVTEKRLRITMSLIGKNKKKDNIHEILLEGLRNNQDERIFKKFIRKDYLYNKNNGLLSNGKLIINCKISLDDEECISSDFNEDYILTCRLEEFDNFEQLLKSEKFSDVKLIVGNKEFHVHKNILSTRSRVFSAMFEHNMQEQEKNLVEIPDIDYEVMQELLRFVYAGKADITKKLAIDLLIAANKYEINGLKIACEEALINNLSTENVGEMLKIVDLYNTEKLKKHLYKFISNNANVINTETFKLALKSLSPYMLSEIVTFLLTLKQ